MYSYTRFLRTASLVVLVALAAALAATGCAPSGTPSTPVPSGATPAALRIGTLATQDALPLWVAADKGYFTAAGIPKVDIITFQSAQEEQAAFSSGAVDALMTDLIVSANLRASGTKVLIATVMLGADTAQGRFAVVGAPKTSFASMKDLAGVPVGAASATITEYVLDKLMEEAGVPAADVKIEQVPKMPVRFQLLMSGQLKAASLPEPFVTLATMQGAKIVPGGDDTSATVNLSQSVLCVSEAYIAKPGGDAALVAALTAWDNAVADINAKPADFRATLVAKANLPAPLATSYPVSSYPKATPPSASDIDRVLAWMRTKGYLKAEVTAEELLSGK
jgi:NitT/TauT family transport system substrate-binding protein